MALEPVAVAAMVVVEEMEDYNSHPQQLPLQPCKEIIYPFCLIEHLYVFLPSKKMTLLIKCTCKEDLVYIEE